LILGFLRFVRKRHNIIISLIRLEFLRIIIFVFLILYLKFGIVDSYLLLYYLVFSVCEGAFGLSLIVLVVRFIGNDIFEILSLIQC